MAPRIRSHLLSAAERPAALERLARAPERNLYLLDLVDGVGRPPARGDVTPQVLAAWPTEGRSAAEPAGLAAVRPSLVLDATMDPAVVESFVPTIDAIEMGLVKSPEPLVSALWRDLEARGRSALVDRVETAYRLKGGAVRDGEPTRGLCVRPARDADLEALVFAARASLREEKRPDPFEGDPGGFRRWVRSRIPRARVVEADGEVVFVGYADVRRREGWLIQGVFTWPAWRRRGVASVGMAALVREAAESGADHAQLAVVDGNTAAVRLYRRLGFEPFDVLRTILFY